MNKGIGFPLARLSAIFMLVVPLLTACLTAKLTVTPNTPTLTAGGSPVTVTARLENTSGTVVWELSGPGSIPSDSTGPTVSYTPPASVPGASSATLTARVGTLSDAANITINPAPPPAPDTTAPTVVSVTPANNAIGVRADANIVVTFSERMNQAATQGAYNSGDVPSITFSWNAEGTVLTINPSTDLAYSGAGLDRIYHFSFNDSAKDSAGNALAAASYSFRTLRSLSITLPSQAALDGDVWDDLSGVGGAITMSNSLTPGDSASFPPAYNYISFLSFNLSGLPNDLDSISYAELGVYQSGVVGSPYTSLSGGSAGSSHLRVAHANYGPSLGHDDYNLSTFLNPDLGTDLSSDATLGWKHLRTPDLVAAVQEDVANRAARGNRSQYALYFPVATNSDRIGDYAILKSGDSATDPPYLYLEYLVP
jgi:hypothetical protein